MTRLRVASHYEEDDFPDTGKNDELTFYTRPKRREPVLNYLFVMPKKSAISSGGYNVFAVGIAYVTAYMKQQKFNVFTANLEFYSESTFHALEKLITEHQIDCICTSGLSRDYFRVKEIIDTAKSIKSDIIAIIGGGIITGDPLPAMTALEADVGVVGQGEITMSELASALDNNDSLAGIKGLIYKKGDEYVTTGLRREVSELDALPFPDYDGFNYAAYMEQINHEVAYVIASRSCPFKCTFCFHPSGDIYRKRSLDNVFLELEYLINTYKVKNIVISDELFSPKRDRVIEFCNRIAKYNVVWSCQLRVSDVDEELIRIMREAGCHCISYGIESADDTVLTSMHKKITLKQIEHALKITYEGNIEIQGGLIFGDIAETNDTVRNTLQWNDQHLQYGLELNMINIFPGTILYDHACSQGVIKDKVDYLLKGCPLINVSQLTDSEYKDLASNLYERNMRSKYEASGSNIHSLDHQHGTCCIDAICDKCGNTFSVPGDALHINKVRCNQCKQRYYIDSFKRLRHDVNLFDNLFHDDGIVALWGAGEICIKMLDHYAALGDDKYIVVDSSGSRQGYSVCGKDILPPDAISANNIKSVIVTVLTRKDEILKQLDDFPCVSRIYLPSTEASEEGAQFTLTEIQ